jgi:4a-hydroxytetrahydrobiopterin dehydratase
MDWEEKNNYLVKTFTFRNFISAFMFMTEVAALAEKMAHHPWWENSYHVVTIRLTTHDAGDTVTREDHEMAGKIDEIYNRMRN